MDAGILERNITGVRERIARAANGREVKIVAATKTVPADVIALLPRFGITAAGENRTREFLDKYSPALVPEWHFIGRLQTNKVKYLIGKTSLIQSLDRIALAAEIDRRCAAADVPYADALIEVNIDGEAQKGGVPPSELFGFVKALRAFTRVRVRGLMAMPSPVRLAPGEPVPGEPVPGEPFPEKHGTGARGRSAYLQMRELYDILKKSRDDVRYLSVGMSGDFETAVRCGANMVRIGGAFFGARGQIMKGITEK